MLAPSLLAASEYYNTPMSEKSLPTKKRLSSPQRYAEGDSQEDSSSGHSAMERKVSDITSDISLDNLLEGSRRKRNKFSSELPLVPLPSPADATFNHGHARTQSGARNWAESASTSGTTLQTPGRVSFPTPAPTTISEEDVALQLIRLGDPSLSPCKVASNDSSSPISNLASAMQFKALQDEETAQHVASGKREMEYPSSPPASVSDSQDLPPSRGLVRPVADQAEGSIDSRASTLRDHELVSKDETDVEVDIEIPRPQNLPHFHDAMQHGTSGIPTPLEDDTPKKHGPSVGVRCTRCKKSKKGCDRQRPCGRCTDANEDCVTEDESSGRRGRNNRGGRRKR